jgi:shikimate kinase
MIGMMGCGKSTIGKLVARRLGRPFVDTDALIEAEASCRIRDIFARYGELHFRQLERAAIARLAESDEPRVIAVGGGAVMSDENVEALRRVGVLVYLKVSPQGLASRVRAARTRPLLAGRGDKEKAIAELLRVREPRYRLADVTVCTDGLCVPEATERVLSALGFGVDDARGDA